MPRASIHTIYYDYPVFHKASLLLLAIPLPLCSNKDPAEDDPNCGPLSSHRPLHWLRTHTQTGGGTEAEDQEAITTPP